MGNVAWFLDEIIKAMRIINGICLEYKMILIFLAMGLDVLFEMGSLNMANRKPGA